MSSIMRAIETAIMFSGGAVVAGAAMHKSSGLPASPVVMLLGGVAASAAAWRLYANSQGRMIVHVLVGLIIFEVVKSLNEISRIPFTMPAQQAQHNFLAEHTAPKWR